MSGFSPAMMQSLMTANTALTSAQTSQKAISHMDSRKQILETEIKSGHGDIEGKKEEIERIDAQRAETVQMQQDALNEASSQLGSAITEETQTAGDDRSEKEAGASEKAKDKAEALQEKLKDTDVTAVDYERGMHIESEGRTSVAVSPALLEKAADSAGEEEALAASIAKMHSLETQHSEPAIVRQSWSVDKDGIVTHHVSVRNTTSRQEAAALHERLRTDEKAAFGSAYGTTVVTKENVPAAVPPRPGLLVDTAL